MVDGGLTDWLVGCRWVKEESISVSSGICKLIRFDWVVWLYFNRIPSKRRANIIYKRHLITKECKYWWRYVSLTCLFNSFSHLMYILTIFKPNDLFILSCVLEEKTHLINSQSNEFLTITTKGEEGQKGREEWILFVTIGISIGTHVARLVFKWMEVKWNYFQTRRSFHFVGN